MGDSRGPLGVRAVRVHELADSLAADITPDVDGREAIEVLAEVQAAISQLELSRLKLTERVDRSGVFADDGSRSAFAYVRRSANETAPFAALQVHLGRALADRMPHTRKAWEAGQLGKAQTRLIADAIDEVDDDRAAGIEEALAMAAPNLSLQDLKTLAQLIRDQHAPDEAARRSKSEYDKQSLSPVSASKRPSTATPRRNAAKHTTGRHGPKAAKPNPNTSPCNASPTIT